MRFLPPVLLILLGFALGCATGKDADDLDCDEDEVEDGECVPAEDWSEANVEGCEDWRGHRLCGMGGEWDSIDCSAFAAIDCDASDYFDCTVEHTECSEDGDIDANWDSCEDLLECE